MKELSLKVLLEAPTTKLVVSSSSFKFDNLLLIMYNFGFVWATNLYKLLQKGIVSINLKDIVQRFGFILVCNK